MSSSRTAARIRKLEGVLGSARCQCESPLRPFCGVLEQTASAAGELVDRPIDELTASALAYRCSVHGVVGPRLRVVLSHSSVICGGREARA